ncbi:MAG: hypothetical protein WCA84_05220 [Ignavibacteriaceae bacterium]|jgi:hypothetical protein
MPNIVSPENFYRNGLKEENVKNIRYLPKIKLDVATKSVKKNGKWYLSTELKNSTITPALMVRLNVVGDKDKEKILPAIYSDYYVSLMPGVRRIIKIGMDNSDTRGNKPKIRTDGININ